MPSIPHPSSPITHPASPISHPPSRPPHLLTILGPTATGKTALAARVAHAMNGEVISADSRQVYRGMDLGTGKDYGDYIVDGKGIPYHLIDIAEPGEEYNIYQFQHDFYRVYRGIISRGRQPILCGGSGMYLETILKGYRLPEASADEAFQESLNGMSDEELIEKLKVAKPLHNKTDTEDRERLIRALMIAREANQDNSAGGSAEIRTLNPVIFGISFPREMVMARISGRLEKRLDEGLIAEVESLLTRGISPERLIRYGLEYKFVTLFLQGKLNRKELSEGLNIAIRQFAKRQMTWFRRMERQGFMINWIDGRMPEEEKLAAILCKFAAANETQ